MPEGPLNEEARARTPEPAPAAPPLRQGPPASEEAVWRVRALGDELVRIHDGLRQELAAVREGLQARRGGQPAGRDPGGTPAAVPAPGLTEQLGERCVRFCGGLEAHHTGEDTLGFPRLEREFPELRPAIGRLRSEHVAVARISRDLQALLAGSGSGDLAPVRAGVERLASELEGHFAFEEEQLVGVLNELTTPPAA